jgi:hypothetical protein
MTNQWDAYQCGRHQVTVYGPDKVWLAEHEATEHPELAEPSPAGWAHLKASAYTVHRFLLKLNDAAETLGWNTDRWREVNDMASDVSRYFNPTVRLQHGAPSPEVWTAVMHGGPGDGDRRALPGQAPEWITAGQVQGQISETDYQVAPLAHYRLERIENGIAHYQFHSSEIRT